MYICLCVHIYIFFIGRGGYGHVMLCKNKLDGRQYAVKKIRLKEKSLRDRMLRSASAVETDRRRKCLTSIIIPSPINFFTQKCLFTSQDGSYFVCPLEHHAPYQVKSSYQ